MKFRSPKLHFCRIVLFVGVIVALLITSVYTMVYGFPSFSLTEPTPSLDEFSSEVAELPSNSTLSPTFPYTSSGSAFVTFVIPSKNRGTLKATLESLLAQSDPDWRAIIIFHQDSNAAILNKGSDIERLTMELIQSDSRFEYRFLAKRKTYQKNLNGGGYLRNYGIKLAAEQTSKWVAFVDDDDDLSPLYVSSLREEHVKSPTQVLIVFRMIYNDGAILPALEEEKLSLNRVGISFALQTILYPKHQFVTYSPCEDYLLLLQVYMHGDPILLSSFIRYRVRPKKLMNDSEYVEMANSLEEKCTRVENVEVIASEKAFQFRFPGEEAN
jgi:hypothetical protein